MKGNAKDIFEEVKRKLNKERGNSRVHIRNGYLLVNTSLYQELEYLYKDNIIRVNQGDYTKWGMAQIDNIFIICDPSLEYKKYKLLIDIEDIYA